MPEQGALLLWMISILVVSCCIFSSKFSRFIDANNDSRRKNLDGLRFFLSVFVVFHHYGLSYFYFEGKGWVLENLNDYPLNLRIGSAAVMMFFILSGYLFYGMKPERWDLFYFKRVLRIVPIFVVSSLCCVAIAAYTRRHNLDFTDFRYTILFWFDGGVTGVKPAVLGMADATLINAGVTWTLFWEWALYFSLPLVILLRQKAMPLTGALICLFLSAYVVHGINPGYGVFLACFSCGFLARAFVPSFTMTKLHYDLSAVVCVVLAFLFYNTPYSLYSLPALTLLFIFIVNGADLFGLLTHRAIVRLGEISYSIYLLHGIGWYCMNYALKSSGLSVDVKIYMIFSSVGFITILLLSAATYKYIEKPFIQLSMRSAKKAETRSPI